MKGAKDRLQRTIMIWLESMKKTSRIALPNVLRDKVCDRPGNGANDRVFQGNGSLEINQSNTQEPRKKKEGRQEKAEAGGGEEVVVVVEEEESEKKRQEYKEEKLTNIKISAKSSLHDRIIDFLARCQHPQGGYGGGPSQYAHLAPTYAAVCAILTIGSKEAYNSINRVSLYKFLMRMKQPNGAFSITDNGEADTRGTYTALAVAKMTGILTKELARGVGDWLARYIL